MPTVRAMTGLSHFLEECCEIGDSFEQKSGELYQEYRAYCFRNGEYVPYNGAIHFLRVYNCRKPPYADQRYSRSA